MSIESADAVKRLEIVRILEQICQTLELTVPQHELAQTSI